MSSQTLAHENVKGLVQFRIMFRKNNKTVFLNRSSYLLTYCRGQITMSSEPVLKIEMTS